MKANISSEMYCHIEFTIALHKIMVDKHANPVICAVFGCINNIPSIEEHESYHT